MNYYQLLEIEPTCGFDTLKRAYYRKAKACHPDRFGNSPQKKAEFQQLVEAFNVLSDPEQRSLYDEQLNVVNETLQNVRTDDFSIMDTESDDTLEELIVGNNVPENATLLTLFLDLERTYVFMTWREARYFFSIRKYRTARTIFARLVRMSPTNILYRVYLARSCSALHQWERAKYHYRIALAIGRRRRPPQRMVNVQRELDRVSRNQFPLLYKLMNFWNPHEIVEILSPEEQAIRETNRAIAKIFREEAQQKQIKRKENRLLR